MMRVTKYPDLEKYAWFQKDRPTGPFKQIVYEINADIMQAGNYVGNYLDALRRMGAWAIGVTESNVDGKHVFEVHGRVALNQKTPKNDTEGFRTLDEAIVAHIETALGITRGNKTEAARILGIKRTTLVEKMKKLGMM